jgi:hypothetical protein
MDTKTDDTKRDERSKTRPWENWMSCGPNSAATTGCCGTDATEMAGSYDCGAFFKKHRLAAFVALTGAGLTFLIVLTGFILGIVAFFRTI